MNTATITGLVFALLALAGCRGQAEDATTAAAPTTVPDPSATSVATGGWKAGDTIPSGKDGVPDIKILSVKRNGDGPVCGTGKSATLAYTAMLADGTVIDPGHRPFTFTVGSGQAIKGWDVIVSKMRVGDSFTVTLPQQLAYGPSKGDLKFDMELLSFK
ncbi:MAG: FKBP-type peptidyl-prolyl cis-trans isomerase [Planctomycetes bacterium]|nr:FKBP-type peptidyl-prolyl cis-trans isomerase [Planctomycetota bacterium]MCB9905908.1 FKBP-type peptidyl-prolyl cis-trans isomerase [Planctomycetota bacterium]